MLLTSSNLTQTFYQICECEGLQETIGFLKQQLNDALELRNFSPLASYSQRFAEAKSLNGEHQIDKEIALLKDINEDSHLQVQVYIISWPVHDIYKPFVSQLELCLTINFVDSV